MSDQEFRAAAWAPHIDYDALEAGTTDPGSERDWLQRRVDLAAAWARERAAADGVGLVLRVPSHADDFRHPSSRLAGFAGDAAVLTNKGGRSQKPATVLVHEGYAEEIRRGMDDADGSSIVVTEHPAFPLKGWAMTLGALDLRTMRPTPDTRTAEQIALLDDLVGSLYGGWSHPTGKRAGRGYLAALAEAGMTRAVCEGSLLAVAPERCDRKAIDRHAPAAWREETRARSRRITRPL